MIRLQRDAAVHYVRPYGRTRIIVAGGGEGKPLAFYVTTYPVPAFGHAFEFEPGWRDSWAVLQILLDGGYHEIVDAKP